MNKKLYTHFSPRAIYFIRILRLKFVEDLGAKCFKNAILVIPIFLS